MTGEVKKAAGRPKKNVAEPKKSEKKEAKKTSRKNRSAEKPSAKKANHVTKVKVAMPFSLAELKRAYIHSEGWTSTKITKKEISEWILRLSIKEVSKFAR
jgi:hypothetical protein